MVCSLLSWIHTFTLKLAEVIKSFMYNNVWVLQIIIYKAQYIISTQRHTTTYWLKINILPHLFLHICFITWYCRGFCWVSWENIFWDHICCCFCDRKCPPGAGESTSSEYRYLMRGPHRALCCNIVLIVATVDCCFDDAGFCEWSECVALVAHQSELTSSLLSQAH